MNLCDLDDVSNVCPTDCDMLTYINGEWVSSKPFNDRFFVVDDRCKVSIAISPDDCNLLRSTDSGLFVCPPNISGAFTSCIETSVSGSGCDNDPYIFFSEPIIKNDPKNCLECTDNGLFVSQTHMFQISAPDLYCETPGGFIPRQYFHIASLADEKVFKTHVNVAQSPYGSDMVLHVFDSTDDRFLDKLTIKAGSTEAVSDKGFLIEEGHSVGIRVDSGPLDPECAACFLSAQFYYTQDCVSP